MPRSAAREILVAPQAKILQKNINFLKKKIDFSLILLQKSKIFALKKIWPPP